jgi:hypothetical protein
MSDRNPDRDGDGRVARREERRRARHARREARLGKGGAWIGGVILIALGVIFLLQNFGFPVPKNWWAIFIMIPGIAALGGAWTIYEREGTWSGAMVGSLVAGLVMIGMSLVFFFGFDFGKFWPVILILLGIGALSGTIWPRGRSRE